MTTKCSAREIQEFIKYCSTIDACKPYLDDLLSQSPLRVNFAMRRQGTELIFDNNGDNHHPSLWFNVAPCLFTESRKAVQNAEVFWPPMKQTRFQEYIFHGWFYTNKCKFEFSAEQWKTIEQLRIIANDYKTRERATQDELCSIYNIPPTSLPLDNTAVDEAIKRFTAR